MLVHVGLPILGMTLDANSVLVGMLTHIFIALYSHGVLLDP